MVTPTGPRSSLIVMAFLVVVAFAPGGDVRAQTTCRTPDCAQGSLPAGCARRAAPYTTTVEMTTVALDFVFIPADPKIEPGDCIGWRAVTVAHSSSADPCPLDLCTNPPPPSCLWESGDVDSLSATPSVVCHYAPATYPAGTDDGYYCRFHDDPSHAGTMHGTLRVTTPIVLKVDKDKTAGDVVLSWSGGGVAGDVTYKIVRSNVGNPAFPAATSQTADPTGGPTGTTFRDVGELNLPQTRFYLARNRQTNE